MASMDLFEHMTQNELNNASIRRLSIHITDRCNLCCDFCGFESGPNRTTELSLMDLQRLVTLAKSIKIPLVEISGGEPLLHSRFWDIMDLFKGVRFVGLITNGTLISPADAARLSTYILNAVKVSFDHNELNDKAIRGAQYMALEGIRVKAMVTVTESTSPADVLATVKKAQDTGMWRTVLRAVEPNGRAARSKLPKERILKDIATKSLEYYGHEFLEFSCGFEFVEATCNYPSSKDDKRNITVLTNGDLFHDHCAYTEAVRNGKIPIILGNIGRANPFNPTPTPPQPQ